MQPFNKSFEDSSYFVKGNCSSRKQHPIAQQMYKSKVHFDRFLSRVSSSRPLTATPSPTKWVLKSRDQEVVSVVSNKPQKLKYLLSHDKRDFKPARI